MTKTSGVINIYKEPDFTSHDVVAIVRKLTRLKCGHTGTLDPQAEGVLPICLGRATKIADYIGGGIKEYEAEVIFGSETDTQDYTGEILREAPLTIGIDELNSIIDSFVGNIEQIPPMYSAVKIDGKKLYQLARQGKQVERKPRPVTIHEIEVLDTALPERMRIRVLCSKGTYIRTLCQDIGERAGATAHMGKLIRTRAGAFTAVEAIRIDELRRYAEQDSIDELMLPIETALKDIPKVTALDVPNIDVNKILLNGNRITFNLVDEVPQAEQARVYNAQNELIGIYNIDHNEQLLRPQTFLYEGRT